MTTKKKIRTIYRVELNISSREEFARVMKTIHAEVVGKKSDKKEEKFFAEAYLDEKQIEYLKQNNFSYKIIENATEKGLQRQKEVGKGNRYEKVNAIPKGLGKKNK